MATISTGQNDGKKRSVDHEIPLIPFIDLLLCCVMFLLVTAVWNKLASVDANLATPADPDGIAQRTDTEPLTVRVEANGYLVASSVGDRTRIPLEAGRYDVAALREHLSARRRIAPSEHAAIVTADDGVPYSEVIQAMDVLSSTEFHTVTITGSI